MSTKPEIVSDAPFKAWPFSSGFNFAYKNGRDTAAACKYSYPLVVKPTITHCCKELHLKCGRVPRSLFENVAMHENRFHMKSSLFSHYFKMLPPLSKVTVFSLLLFTVWWSNFDLPFRWLLPLSCFFESSQWLFKVKITCKRVSFNKK